MSIMPDNPMQSRKSGVAHQSKHLLPIDTKANQTAKAPTSLQGIEAMNSGNSVDNSAATKTASPNSTVIKGNK